MFVENVGQFDPGARFVLPGASTTLFLADDALWLTMVERDPGSAEAVTKGVHLRLSFAGATPHPRLEPFGRLNTAVSYIIGGVSQARYANVPVWAGVRYVNLYSGIDLELAGAAGQLAPTTVLAGLVNPAPPREG